MDTYKINVEGLDRELRKFPVNDKLDIAAFIMFGDIEMTEVAARELLKNLGMAVEDLPQSPKVIVDTWE